MRQYGQGESDECGDESQLMPIIAAYRALRKIKSRGRVSPIILTIMLRNDLIEHLSHFSRFINILHNISALEF